MRKYEPKNRFTNQLDSHSDFKHLIESCDKNVLVELDEIYGSMMHCKYVFCKLQINLQTTYTIRKLLSIVAFPDLFSYVFL